MSKQCPAVEFHSYVRKNRQSYPLPFVWTHARLPLLPRNRLRRGPLVDLPLKNLRTGNTLFCVGWRNGKLWFLAPAQYNSLLKAVPLITHWKKPKSRTTDELESDKPEYDEFSLLVRRNRRDVISDRDWVCSYAAPFNPSDWQSVPIGHAHLPQMPPEPFPGVDEYSCVIGSGSKRFDFIPSLK